MIRTGFEGYVSARAGVKKIATTKASDVALKNDVVGFMKFLETTITETAFSVFVARSD
jgi:hypothetical protein